MTILEITKALAKDVMKDPFHVTIHEDNVRELIPFHLTITTNY